MRHHRIKYFMMAPALIVLGATTLYPFLYAFIISFRHWRLSRSMTPGPFVGLENYTRAFVDANFWNCVNITMQFTFISVALSIVLGLIIALLLRRSTPFNTFMRSMMIFPFAISPALKGFTFRFMLNPHFGVIDKIIGFLAPPLADVVWLGEAKVAMFWLAITEVYSWAPFIALAFIGALDSMSQEVFDAAQVDGASPMQAFRYITLPMLKPIIIIITLLKAIFSVKMFDQVVTLTGGGPGRATETMNYYVYKIGFHFYDMGYASALAYLLVIVLFFFALFYVKALIQKEA